MGPALALVLALGPRSGPGELPVKAPPPEVDGQFELSTGLGVMSSTLMRAGTGFGVTLETDEFRGSFGAAAGYLGPHPTPAFNELDPLPGTTHVATAGPRVRLGAANKHGWGYGVLSGGYAHRIDLPTCTVGCPSVIHRHGAFFSFGFGGLVPVQSHVWIGGEMHIDHSFGLDRGLWTQVYALEMTVAFSFVGDGDRVREPIRRGLAGRRSRRRPG